MAELNVQPKKKSSILPWILLLLGIAALVWFLLRDRGDNRVGDNVTPAAATTDSNNNAGGNEWTGIDFNAPGVKYDEITDTNINVRGNNNYAIYGIGENILFDEGKATIRNQAETNLNQIVSSIGRRYNEGNIRVYGFTDSQGSAGSNKELAEQRAQAVKTWMQNNGIDSSRITVNAIGEEQPVASNSTEQGRQQNRRVEIVARNN